jgi:hypothetical protein
MAGEALGSRDYGGGTAVVGLYTATGNQRISTFLKRLGNVVFELA